MLWYASYQQFASDVHSGVITYPYQWVMYDPEHSSRTPLKEQQDPGTYLRLFAQLAHAHGYKVIESPARVLGLAAGAVCPLEQGETLNDWYLRCDLPGLAAAYSDIVLIQDQANMKHVSAYAPFFNSAQQEALAVNRNVQVMSQVSTNRGTAAQMIAAAKSVTAEGYYVTINDNAVAKAIKFFTAMQAAGY